MVEQVDYAMAQAIELRNLNEQETEVMKRLIWKNMLVNLCKKYRFDEVTFTIVLIADCFAFLV